MSAKYPKELQHLIAFLKKLPGVGHKTAERFAFHLLTWEESEQLFFSETIAHIKKNITNCPSCRALMDQKKCLFCTSQERDRSLTCLVSSPKDIYSIEDTRTFNGLYYVISCLLSPLDGRHPEEMNLRHFHDFLLHNKTREVIIALDSTLEGDATALFLKKQLDEWGVHVTRLAYGLPVGGSLEYIDGGTLAKALSGRQSFH